MSKTTIPLDFPVDVEGVAVTSLSMRRPKVADQLLTDQMVGTEGDKEASLFANLCLVKPDTIKALDMFDYVKLQRVYTGFLFSRAIPASYVEIASSSPVPPAGVAPN